MTSTLAIRPAPGPDEALPGYLLRIAKRNDLPVGHLTRQIVGNRGGTLLSLTPTQRASARSLLKLSEQQIDGLVIEPPEMRTSYERNDRAVRGGESVLEWAIRSRHSLACAECLMTSNPGVWQRIWRLAVVIVCPIHETYLERRCSRCRRAWFSNGADPSKRAVPRPYRLSPPPPPTTEGCVAPSSHGWCGAPIQRTIRHVPSGFLVEATRHFLSDWPFNDLDWHRRQAVVRGRQHRPSKEKLDLTDAEIKQVLHAVSRPWRVVPSD